MALGTEFGLAISNIMSQTGLISDTATHYAFTAATKTYDDEGRLTVSQWNNGTTINVAIFNIGEHHSIESRDEEDTSIPCIFYTDALTTNIASKDNITLDEVTYIVDDVTLIYIGPGFILKKIVTHISYD